MTVALELLESMNWRQWEAHVQGLLRFYGWRHFHAPDNKPIAGKRGRAGKQHVERGFPDLVAIRHLRGHGPELIFAELKTGTGRLSPDQRAWRDEVNGLAGALDELVAELVGARVEDLGAGVDSAAAAADVERELRAPAIAHYVWYPRDAEELERKLAGPYGVNVPVDRAAEAAGGDVVDDGQEDLADAIAELEAGAAAAIAELEGGG